MSAADYDPLDSEYEGVVPDTRVDGNTDIGPLSEVTNGTAVTNVTKAVLKAKKAFQE